MFIYTPYIALLSLIKKTCHAIVTSCVVVVVIVLGYIPIVCVSACSPFLS